MFPFAIPGLAPKLHDVVVRVIDADHVIAFPRVYVNHLDGVLYLTDEERTTTVIPLRNIAMYEKKPVEEEVADEPS